MSEPKRRVVPARLAMITVAVTGLLFGGMPSLASAADASAPAGEAERQQLERPAGGTLPEEDRGGDVTPDEAHPGGVTPPDSDAARSATTAGFNPGNIISDAVFYDSGTMSAADIAGFIDGQVPACQEGYTCLEDFRQSTPTRGADAFCPGTYHGAQNESAAAIIAKVAAACGINPRVLLVMLQKEQGLVTHTWPSDWRYTIAMGQGCPDTAGCNERFYGFFNQVYGAARQMKIYAGDDYFSWYPVGQVSDVRYHPNEACGSSPVFIENQATASLYYYTPYQPNRAALNAGYGEGDACSSYGNRNFYNYFTDWFGSTHGGPSETDPCAIPDGRAPNGHAYVIQVDTLNARTAPNTACEDGRTQLSRGTIVQGMERTGDSAWIKVHTMDGDRWISAQYVAEANAEQAKCTVPWEPAGAGETVYVLHRAAARVSPRAECDMGARHLPEGSVLKATMVTGSNEWLRVGTEYGQRWINRADVRGADATEAMYCTEQSGPYKPAEGSYYVIDGTAVGRTIPNGACPVLAQGIRYGTVVEASATTHDGSWVRVGFDDGRQRWLPSHQLSSRAVDGNGLPIGITGPLMVDRQG